MIEYWIGWRIDARQACVPSGTTSSDPPRPCSRMDAASCTTTLTESFPGGGRRETEQRRDQRWVVRPTGAVLIHHFYLFPLKDRDVGKLAKSLHATLLDHQQPGFDNLQDKAEAWNRPRGSPHVQCLPLAPDTEMNTRTFNGRPELGEDARGELKAAFEDERLACLLGREEREGNLRGMAFLAP